MHKNVKREYNISSKYIEPFHHSIPPLFKPMPDGKKISICHNTLPTSSFTCLGKIHLPVWSFICIDSPDTVLFFCTIQKPVVNIICLRNFILPKITCFQPFSAACYTNFSTIRFGNLHKKRSDFSTLIQNAQILCSLRFHGTKTGYSSFYSQFPLHFAAEAPLIFRTQSSIMR